MHLFRIAFFLSVVCYTSAHVAKAFSDSYLNEFDRQPGYAIAQTPQYGVDLSPAYAHPSQALAVAHVSYQSYAAPSTMSASHPMQPYQLNAPPITTTTRPYSHQQYVTSYTVPTTTAAPYQASQQQYMQTPVRPTQQYAPAYSQSHNSASYYADTTTTARPYNNAPQQKYEQQQQYAHVYVQPSTTSAYYAETTTTARPYYNSPQQQVIYGQGYHSATTTRPAYNQQQPQYRPVFRPTPVQYPNTIYPNTYRPPPPQYSPAQRGTESNAEDE